MKIRIALLTASVALLAGCGEDVGNLLDGGTEPQYAFSGGTFAVSNALAVGTDQCGLLPAYQDASKAIEIQMAGSALTFNLSNQPNQADNTLPKATLEGTTINSNGEANYTFAADDNCVVRIHRSVSGSVVADNTAALTLTFSVQTEAGTCTGTNSGFDAVPCSSTYQFTATHQ